MGVRFWFNNRYYDVPGAKSKIEVIQNLVGTVQDMGVTLIVGRAMAGTPGLAQDGEVHEGQYNTGGEATPGDRRYVSDIAPVFSDSAAARRLFGEDAEIVRMLSQFKVQGGPMAFLMNPQPLTRTSGTLLKTAAEAVDVWSREFGAHTNDIYYSITAVETTKRAIEITKPRHIRYLAADTTALSTSITIDSSDPKCINHLIAGNVVHLVDNDHIGESGITLTVDTVDYANKTINFTEAVGAIFLTSKYARIFEMNLDDAIEDGGKPRTADESTSTALETVAQFVEWIQDNSAILDCELGSGGGMPDEAYGWLGDIVTNIANGTSPLPDTDDWTAFMVQMKSVIRENEVRIVVIGDDPDGLVQVEGDDEENLNHISLAELKELIADLETGDPKQLITVILGCALGDTLEETSSARYPNARTATMNNDRIVLADIGCDEEAAYLTYAPQVAGDLASHNTNHNLTNDAIIATEIEQELRNYTDELAPRVRAGVLTMKSTKIGPVICRGMNTYQDNTNYWNSEEGRTCSIMRRRIVDEVELTLQGGFDATQVGKDGVTKAKVETYADSTLAMLRKKGIILEYSSATVTRTDGAWSVTIQIRTDEESDFFGITVQVLG